MARVLGYPFFLKGFQQVQASPLVCNKAKVDVFLEVSCFF